MLQDGRRISMDTQTQILGQRKMSEPDDLRQLGRANAADTDRKTAIRFSDVHQVFKTKTSSVNALEKMNLDIAAGEFVSIVGPSGCGKSTLMQIAAGFVKPSSGQVEINGKVVRGPVTDLGVVFQKDVLFDWKTVMENVLLQARVRRLPLEPARARARQLISDVGLKDFEQSYPWQLSGGMRQRVSICRALLHDAPLLMFDEPFGALDAITRDQMTLDLQRIWYASRKTTLFITHDIAEAIFLSDRVLVMSPRPGRVLADIAIDLPRPRDFDARRDPRFIDYESHIRSIFRSWEVIR